MKAKLIIENVGGLRGKNEYQLESGKLNIVKAPNTGGKTSFIRGITSVLSTPNNGHYDIYFLKEAQKIGIKTDERNPRESFVNLYSKHANVELKYDNISESYKMEKNGNYLKLPDKGDQRFLFGGFLSNTSKVLRQLDGLDEENEPDDFHWAVTKLSYAKQYDEISGYLKTLKENIIEKKIQAEKEIKRISDLELEKKKLEQKHKEIEDKMIKYEPRFRKESQKLIPKRKKTAKYIENGKNDLKRKKNELSELLKELEERKEKLNNLKSETKNIKENIEEINLENRKELMEKNIIETDKKINSLKKKRDELNGILNLYQTAQVELRKDKEKVTCPLCGDGTISFSEITEKLEELRSKKNNFSGEILKLNQEKNLSLKSFKKIESERLRLEDELENKKGEVKNFKESINSKKIDIDNLKHDIERKKESIKKLEHKFIKLKQGISPEDEKINNLYTEKEKERAQISNRITDIDTKLNQISIEMSNFVVDPKIALKISEEWIRIMEYYINYCKTKGEEQRKKASEKFNTNIKDLMNSLGFGEFRNVKLNNEYKLYVERLNPKTGDYTFQQVKSLSTSEKLSMALILQLALKETYIPDIPFFILDDIIEDFDDERRERFLNYLKKKAEETGWFIITTKLIEEEKPLYIEVRG